jgi:hypothetical protein
MNIVEVISNEGVKSTSGEHDVSKRYQKPMPGDPVLFDSDEYPFNSRPYGRIDGVNNLGSEDEISICCGGASVFLGKDGNVSISGGPFEPVKIADLEPQFELMPVSFWNWGDNSPGADMGIHYTIERPVFKLKITERKP